MISKGLPESLTSAGMAVDWFADGVHAREALAGAHYDAVVLDLGFDVREFGENTAVSRRAARHYAAAGLLTTSELIPPHLSLSPSHSRW